MNEVENFSKYLKFLVDSAGKWGSVTGALDFWIWIIGDPEFIETGSYSGFETKEGHWVAWKGVKNQIYPNREEKHPFPLDVLEKITSHTAITLGEFELGETILIDNINPLRFCKNLQSLNICGNMVKTLEPIWHHKYIHTIWMEQTKVPDNEREKFELEHPDCKVYTQVFN